MTWQNFQQMNNDKKSNTNITILETHNTRTQQYSELLSGADLESIYHRSTEIANEGDGSNDFDYAFITEGDDHVDEG